MGVTSTLNSHLRNTAGLPDTQNPSLNPSLNPNLKPKSTVIIRCNTRDLSGLDATGLMNLIKNVTFKKRNYSTSYSVSHIKYRWQAISQVYTVLHSVVKNV